MNGSQENCTYKFWKGSFFLNNPLYGISTHPVKHICPPLQGDTLKHSEHGLWEVVETCDAPLWTLPLMTTHISLITLVDTTTGSGFGHYFSCWIINRCNLTGTFYTEAHLSLSNLKNIPQLELTCNIIKASLVEGPKKQFKTNNGVDDDNKND